MLRLDWKSHISLFTIFIGLVVFTLCALSFKYGQFNTTQYINKLGVLLVSRPTTDSNREWIETISWTPRAFIYHNILTEDECQHIIDIGKTHLSRSEVVRDNPDASGVDDARTSFGVFLTGSLGSDKVVLKLQKKNSSVDSYTRRKRGIFLSITL